MKAHGILAVVAVSALSGCILTDWDGHGGSQPPETTLAPPAPSTTRAYLGSPRKLRIMSGGHAGVTGRRTVGDDVEEKAELPIAGGELTMHARPDGQLVVDGLTLSLGDFHLSARSVPPDGLDLTGVTVSLRNEAPSDVRWTQDGSAAEATGDVRMLLDWSMRGIDGAILPLATQRIEAVPIDLNIITQRNGKLAVLMHADRDGVFWAWTGFELADLRLDVEAAE